MNMFLAKERLFKKILKCALLTFFSLPWSPLNLKHKTDLKSLHCTHPEFLTCKTKWVNVDI